MELAGHQTFREEGDLGAAKWDPCGLKGGEEGKEEAGKALPNSNRLATVGK